eukprot:1943615-Prorocentrum_lima.AAC.1
MDEITVFSDSDWARCPETRRSTTGALLKVAGRVQGHTCRTQRVISHSSAESEFCAAAAATAEA